MAVKTKPQVMPLLPFKGAETHSTAPVVCNGCLVLVDPEWEPVVRIGEYSFHPKCAPVCEVCGGPLVYRGHVQADDFYVLDSRVEFMSSRGYQIRLKVCCCASCYSRALHDDPAAGG